MDRRFPPFLRAPLAVALVAAAWPAAAALDEAQRQAVHRFAETAAQRALTELPGARRVEVRVGAADARLKLAPCARAEAVTVAGAPAWGTTRVGLRCLEGTTRWSITVPVTVAVHGRALVAARPLGAGMTITTDDLREAEVDLAADRSPALVTSQALVGRELQRAAGPGETLRQSHLRARQWFGAGDVVRLVARGDGFQVSGSGQALDPGIEGRSVRVRTESGRVLSVVPSGEREAQVRL
jgi:flagella basal body P-ring formation protein FlgA